MSPHTVRWLREQALFLFVLVVFSTGFAYLVVGPGHWRRSTALMGVALLLAGLLRAGVPTSRVGLLGVRARWIDTVVYLALGVLVLAVDIRLHR